MVLAKSKNSDSQIYVKSEFFKNYSSDMYVDMDKHMSAETKPSSWFGDFDIHVEI